MVLVFNLLYVFDILKIGTLTTIAGDISYFNQSCKSKILSYDVGVN